MTTDIYDTPGAARNSGSPAELRLCYRSGQPDVVGLYQAASELRSLVLEAAAGGHRRNEILLRMAEVLRAARRHRRALRQASWTVRP